MDLVTRITNIVSKPKTEWPVIAKEQTDVATLFRTYIMPLAAIPVIASLIGQTVIGVSLPFVGRVRTGITTGLVSAVLQYGLALVSCYLAAFVIEKLAPKFASKGDIVQALKLVAYAYTPAWVAGVLGIIPVLGVLVLLASLYSIYLFYLGLPELMQTPADKVVPYMVVSALVIIVLSIVAGAIVAAVSAPALLPRM
jgi:hypothetical protein